MKLINRSVRPGAGGEKGRGWRGRGARGREGEGGGGRCDRREVGVTDLGQSKSIPTTRTFSVL